MDRHPYRPAHIHLIVSISASKQIRADTQVQVMLDGFKSITTQIFDSEGEYLDNDSVFAVKDSLVVKFIPRKNDSKAGLELKYDILMVPNDQIGEFGPPLRSSGIGAGY
jgi:catechol 1,2-dioxygenase